jgi:hypothetical protein
MSSAMGRRVSPTRSTRPESIGLSATFTPMIKSRQSKDRIIYVVYQLLRKPAAYPQDTNSTQISLSSSPLILLNTKASHWQMDLLVDSNLAHMFGPEGAAVYFARLLKVDVRSLQPTMSQEWPHAFFITSPTVQNGAAQAAPTLYINRRPAQLLDYTIRQVGTVVPQAIWPPGNYNNCSSDNAPAPRSAKAASLNMPIFFVGMDRVSLGLPLHVAIAEGDRAPLQGAVSPAPIGHGSTTYIRITVSRHLSQRPRASILLSKMALPFLLVAGLQRVDYADNDPGPNPSTQHDHPREIRKAPRKRRRQVHGSKPLGINQSGSNIYETNLFLLLL